MYSTLKRERWIPVASPDIGDEEVRSVVEAVRSGWISSQGPFVKEFEQRFAEWLGVKHAIACSSGTAALHLALLALGIGPGDEVLVPDLTFASPASMVLAVGARPIFVDVSREYWCIDPNDMRRKITQKTKAVIVVHLYGHPAKMDEVMEVTEEHGLYVIEDCAEAHGAEFQGRIVGSLGHIACFSFYANKVITTGEGGMVVTDDDELADRIGLYRDHGMKPRYWHLVPGFNYRMTNLQAAIGVAQLKRIDELIERKRRIARLYEEMLADVPGLELHPELPWAKCVFWLYSVLIDEQLFGMTRDALIEELAKHGVESRRFFYPLHSMPAFKEYSSEGDAYPVSMYLSEHGLNLPSGPRISDEEVAYVAGVVRSLCRGN